MPFDAALYLRLNWPLLPLAPRAKRPAGLLAPHGVDDATTDPAIVARWFRALPAAGLGIALAPAGLLVIGPDSADWLAVFERLGLPPTAVVESRPGHRHYYRRPEGCPLHRLCRAGEYDILSNGYTVAPPAIHPSTGQPYRWLQPPDPARPLPEAPAWAIEWLMGRVGSGMEPGAGSERPGDGGGMAMVERRENDGAKATEPEPVGPVDGGRPMLGRWPVEIRPRQVAREWWSGQRVVRQPNGLLDRSSTLYILAALLIGHGADPASIPAALAERDRALGYHKYSGRTDGGRREYRRLAEKVREQLEAEVARGALTRLPTPAGTPEMGRPILAGLADVEPEVVIWHWPGRLPFGKLVVLDGDPGLGKTTLLFDLVARLSRGGALPDGAPGQAGGVIILSAEDGLADTIRPRLEAAGADLSRIVALTGIDEEGGPRLPVLPDDLPRLAEAIERVEARLVIIDPIMAYLSGNVNSARDQDVRRALAPLAALAERAGAAIVCVRHLNKTPGGKATYRGGGSIGIIGAARVGLLVAVHPADPTRRVLATIKNNLAPHAPALTWRLEPTASGVARVVWEGVTDQTADDLLAPVEDQGALGEAVEFLLAALAGGERPMTALVAEARPLGITERALRRAKLALGVRSTRRGHDGKPRWMWSLPSTRPANHDADGHLGHLGHVGHLGHLEEERDEDTLEPEVS